MKKLDTLIPDIYKLFTHEHKFNEGNVQAFGKRLAEIIEGRIDQERRAPVLRMSNLGTPCLRKLWYQINRPEAAEPIGGEALLKFLYGHILEELILFLAKEAGHEVVGEQDTLSINGVDGHRDAVIDGVLVDVKSASSYSFAKFADGTLAEDDAFGYLDQINAYLAASRDDPLVRDKERAAFVAIDKTLGKMAILPVTSNGTDYDKRITEIRNVLSSTTPPRRHYDDVPDGKSGNRKLGVSCSYCEFKKTCWPGLRTFKYSKSHTYMTTVGKAPKVEEVTEF